MRTPMRTFWTLTLLLLSAACAGVPKRPEGSPSRVVVVGASVVPKPAPRGLVGDVFGGEEPREVVAREGAEALRSRGFEVVGTEMTLGPSPTTEEAAALVRQYRADAAVVLVLTRLDLTAIQPLGQAEVRMDVAMVDAAGQVLASESRRNTLTGTLYRAQSSWRSHVRQAVIQAVRALP
jgi:hypothetical protein